MVKKIICLWGGPGTGKSTTCAGLFNMLKKQGFNSEMNREYVKDWVWEKRPINDGDQTYITAKQLRKERIYIKNSMDFIITDSPAALTAFYGYKYDKYEREFDACKYMIKQHHKFCADNGYKTEHYYLIRTKPYNPSGRNETEEVARQYDKDMLQFLDSYPINYKMVTCDESAEETIIKDLLGT